MQSSSPQISEIKPGDIWWIKWVLPLFCLNPWPNSMVCWKPSAPDELMAVEDVQHSTGLGPSSMCSCYCQHCWDSENQSEFDGVCYVSCLISIMVFCIPIHWPQLCKSTESRGFIREVSQIELVCTAAPEGIIWTLFCVVICKKKRLNLVPGAKPHRDSDVSHGTVSFYQQKHPPGSGAGAQATMGHQWVVGPSLSSSHEQEWVCGVPSHSRKEDLDDRRCWGLSWSWQCPCGEDAQYLPWRSFLFLVEWLHLHTCLSVVA